MSFGDGKLIAKNGSILEMDEGIWSPKIVAKKSERCRKYASLFLVDCDFPLPEIKLKAQLCLWAKYNVLSDSDGTFTFEPRSNDYLEYIPSHPSRGSSMHRIISVIIEHDRPVLENDLKFLSNDSPFLKDINDSFLQKRFINLQSLLENVQVNISSPLQDIQLLGYQFYYTCWSKYVSNIFKRLGRDEPIYGEVLQSKTPIPSAYSIS